MERLGLSQETVPLEVFKAKDEGLVSAWGNNGGWVYRWVYSWVGGCFHLLCHPPMPRSFFLWLDLDGVVDGVGLRAAVCFRRVFRSTSAGGTTSVAHS